jgi:hypothetical protein
MMSSRPALAYWVLMRVWLGTLIWFWQCWLEREHVVSASGLLLTSHVAAGACPLAARSSLFLQSNLNGRR